MASCDSSLLIAINLIPTPEMLTNNLHKKFMMLPLVQILVVVFAFASMRQHRRPLVSFSRPNLLHLHLHLHPSHPPPALHPISVLPMTPCLVETTILQEPEHWSFCSCSIYSPRSFGMKYRIIVNICLDPRKRVFLVFQLV
jgi:hypothetical protein